MERLLGQHLPVHLVERESHLSLSQSFRPVFVHIDASAAMTGITRYTAVYVCMYVCIYICMYVYILCIYLCIYVFVSIV